MATTKRSSSKKRSTGKKSAKPAKRSAKKAVPTAGAVSDNFTELIGRALTDKDFRKTLFADRAKATKGFALTKTDRSALDRLTPEVLESQAARLGGRASLTIKVVISKSF